MSISYSMTYWRLDPKSRSTMNLMRSQYSSFAIMGLLRVSCESKSPDKPSSSSSRLAEAARGTMKVYWVFLTLGDLAGKYQAFRGIVYLYSKDSPRWAKI